MPEHQKGDIKFYTFSIFDDYGVHHAMITRHGGVSPKPWASLNLSTTVGDDVHYVAENINRVYKTFQIDRLKVYDVWQVHSDRVISTKSPRKANEPHQKADAIISDQKGLTLFMRFADCVPILLFDPYKEVIGIAHAGWKGTVTKIIENTIDAMFRSYGCIANDLIAGIGPSIAAHHYQIGPEVIREVKQEFDINAAGFLISENGKTYFDLWKANQKLLENKGVQQIEVSNLCTACNTTDWFSHRGENGRTGRFGVYISL